MYKTLDQLLSTLDEMAMVFLQPLHYPILDLHAFGQLLLAQLNGAYGIWAPAQQVHG